MLPALSEPGPFVPRRPELMLHSVIRTAWKQKWAAAATFFLVSGLGVFAALSWPAKYKAEAVILVDAQRIPEQYVSGSVQRNLQDRLATITQQVMSINRLQRIIDNFNLYSRERKSKPLEDIIEKMRSDTVVTLERGWTRDQPGAFRVAYIAPTPALAADIANEVAGLFIAENLRDREASAEGTTEFMRDQLATAKRRLDELEIAIGEYKSKYNGELPQQENVLISNVSRLQLELQANQDALNRAQQARFMTESILSIVSSARVAASGSVSPRTPAEDPRIAALRGSLEQARTQYTESHPDVARLKSLLAAAEKQGVTAVQEGPLKIDDPRERERITALESQLKITTDEIASLEADRARITRSLAAAQGRLERLPIREQQMAVVTRDYEIAKASYRSLLDKKFAAEMSTDMERRQKSERFTVLDAARPPGRSFRPDRWLWAGVSCAAGIGFGLLAGFLREAGGGTVLGQWELPNAAPILGRVPRVHGWVQKSRRISWLSRGGRRGTPARSPLGLCPLPDVGVQLGHSDGTPRSDAISLPDALDSPVSMVRPGAERALEEYRIIRTKILHHPLRPQTIVVSSPGPGDGKTTTALNVAAALAMKCQHDVLLVEADLRRPRLKSLLSLPERPGLADILNHSGSVEDAICKCRGLERLQLLPAGDAGSGAAELLDSDCWRNVCQKLRRTFRFILFDAPPIGPVADYDLVQVVSDGIIVVVRPDHTKRAALYDALAGIPEDKLIGIVLNDVPSYFFSKHHSYYGYNYSADQDEHRPAQLTSRAG